MAGYPAKKSTPQGSTGKVTSGSGPVVRKQYRKEISNERILPPAPSSLPPTATRPSDLFGRVAAILEQARAGVVRAVNSHMVLAYWMIVQEMQGGEERAAYGRQAMEELSSKLSQRYGRGFSVTNLSYFRRFYQTYAHRQPVIRRGSGEESAATPIPHKPCGESGVGRIGQRRRRIGLDCPVLK